MDLNNLYSFDYLINESEELVKEALGKEMEKDNTICDCQDCILDIMGLALNNIKPLYKTSLKGSLYTTVPDAKYVETLNKAVKLAIKKVKDNPSHS
ncbi:MAG: late competence development ComFB family protein [Spirochaetaceae bacterium]|nr:late competence development ComFB family protein [Spirochaetaceae bacterium]